MKKTPLFVIFTTVFMDLVGFGMVIPLISIYGKHYGAYGFKLALLGGAFSIMQFFFSPFWGALSDRIGRRPVLLLSLAGSTASYVLFALANNFEWLILSRVIGGLFAANISTAQAYIADITTPADRAKGMGLIGAAFGIGFTLGPPLGGISSSQIGMSAPGWIAAGICGLNLILAFFRLEETLKPELRGKARARSLMPLPIPQLRQAWTHPILGVLFLTFFLTTFAFSNMEQTFSLLFQSKFGFSTPTAGLKTGLVLMFAGFLGALIQGGWIRKLIPRYGEVKLLLWGMLLSMGAMVVFPWMPTYWSYFLIVIPMSMGSSFINPCLSSLISKSADASEQGSVLGLSQGLGSMARALGPISGLLLFESAHYLPFVLAVLIYFYLWVLNRSKLPVTESVL